MEIKNRSRKKRPKIQYIFWPSTPRRTQGTGGSGAPAMVGFPVKLMFSSTEVGQMPKC